MKYHQKNRAQFLNPAAIRAATCLLACSFGSSASAATSVFAQAQGTAGTSQFQRNTAPSGGVSASGSGSSANGFSTLEMASAGFGVLRAYSEARAPLNPNLNSVNSSASVYFTDDYLFDAPGKTGQAGTFNFSLSINGTLSTTLKGAGPEDPNFTRSYASVTLSVFKDGGGLSGGGREQLFADGTTNNTGSLFLNRTNDFAVPFTFGTPFELKVGLTTITTARAQFGADAISDIGHTLEWGGIVSVNDSSNVAVNNYTLSSGSGTNYAQPIPEPSMSVLLMVSGFALSRFRTGPGAAVSA